jgi:hypothetical protein
MTNPTDLERLFHYMRDFEMAFMAGDWSVLDTHFHEDARHTIAGGGGPLGVGGDGRAAVIAGLRGGVEAIDRRFDVRLPEIVEGPVTRDDGVWMRFALTLRRAGLPELRIGGEHLARYRGGRIESLAEHVDADDALRVSTYLAEHDAKLKPAASPFEPPALATDFEALEAATGRSLVRCYGGAKSERDTGAALSVCDEGFWIETIAFGLSSSDREDTRAQLGAFFHTFPDYSVTLEGFATAPGTVTCWGRARLTFSEDFLGLSATGRTADLPIFCVFETAGPSIANERFFFDLAQLCDQIGIPVADMSAALAALRVQAAAA